MHGKLFKLRGFATGRTCPACGGETMRTDVYGALDTLLAVVRLRRRWCRRCLRQWIAPRTLQRPPDLPDA
jgi:hypothetical protein